MSITITGTHCECLAEGCQYAKFVRDKDTEIERLQAALEQALDDMGPDDISGLCVCVETKDMMRSALNQQPMEKA